MSLSSLLSRTQLLHSTWTFRVQFPQKQTVISLKFVVVKNKKRDRSWPILLKKADHKVSFGTVNMRNNIFDEEILLDQKVDKRCESNGKCETCVNTVQCGFF